jgi:hypothetical protein
MSDVDAEQDHRYAHLRLAGIFAIAADAIISTDEGEQNHAVQQGCRTNLRLS